MDTYKLICPLDNQKGTVITEHKSRICKYSFKLENLKCNIDMNIYVLFLIYFNWKIIALQCCTDFCHAAV